MSATRKDRIGIIGAGRFGTALASLVGGAGGHVLLWSRSQIVVEDINEHRENRGRLPSARLSGSVRATNDPQQLADYARLLVVAVPSTEVRERIAAISPFIDGSHFLVHAIGALAGDSGSPPITQLLVSELLCQETATLRVGALAGPALPADLVSGSYSSMVIASRYHELNCEVQRLLSVPPQLRIYRSSDLIGVELAAALSGAYTIAVGIADRLQIGVGPRAVLITRAVAEASRLGSAAGAKEKTFSGLAGLGNTLVRSQGESRDYQLGLTLGAGKKVSETELTEGARAAQAGARLGAALGVDVPVLASVADVVAGRIPPQRAAARAADTVADEE